jgi:hypothetical protein
VPTSFAIASATPHTVLWRYGMLAMLAQLFYLHFWPFYPTGGAEADSRVRRVT